MPDTSPPAASARNGSPPWPWAPAALAGTVLALALAVTYGFWRSARADAARDLQGELDHRVREASILVAKRMESYEEVLRGVAGLFAASESVARGEFREYVTALRLDRSYPGIQGLGYGVRVRRGEVARLAASVRAEGLATYAVRPEGDREEYAPVIYLEPATGRNHLAFGYDMLSEPVRREALEAARDTGEAALTGRLTLVYDRASEPGTILYLPVYRTRPASGTVEERRALLAGWIYASFRMGDLMRGIFGDSADEIDLQLFDGDAPSPATLLHQETPGPWELTPASRFLAERPLHVAGRRWTLRAHSEPRFEARLDTGRQAAVAATGGSLGVLLSLLVFGLASARLGAVRRASAATARAEERRRAEDALRVAGERLKLTLRHAGAGTWELDLASGALAWSREKADLFEWQAPDLVVTRAVWASHLHPDDLAAAEEAMRRALDGLDPEYVAEYRVRSTRIGWRWLLSTGRVERAPDGRPTRVIGLSVDVSRRKAAEEALRRSEKFYRAVLRSSAEFWAVLDRNGRAVRAASSTPAVVGWTEEELKALAPFEAAHPEDRERLAATFRAVAAEPGGTRRLTYRFRHRDGTWRTLEADARNLLGDPDVGGVIVNQRDVTAQRRLEEELQQAQRLESIGRLAGGVAHDFNNILTVVMSCADELREDLAAGAPAKPEAVYEILSASGRARDLTRQLLAFARKQIIEPVPLDLSETLRGSEKLLRRVLGEDVVLVVSLARALWTARCDPGQVEQLILNLAVNARDAMPGGGRLTLETSNATVSGDAEIPAGEYVRLAVSDTGVGMTPEVKAHLFEPFFTTKPQGQGTGLGLATVYGIVKQSEGHIRLQSEPGRGTRFEILLPRTREAPAAPAGDPGAASVWA